jgi:hypothetical protein
MTCHYCMGDGCDPCDYSTISDSVCPACLGSGALSEEEKIAFEKGFTDKLTWDQWMNQLARTRQAARKEAV